VGGLGVYPLVAELQRDIKLLTVFFTVSVSLPSRNRN
jgi:hypothetical protein